MPISPATQSGFTRITLCINNGVYGRLESHVLAGRLYDVDTKSKALTLAGNRASLLGSEGTVAQAPTGKSRGNPRVEFIKLQDAFYPKLGYVITTDKGAFFGALFNSPYPADALSTALSFRMYGAQTTLVNAGTGALVNTTKAANLLINGQPDDAVISDDYSQIFKRGAQFYKDDVKGYLDLLIGGGIGTFGFVGQAVVTGGVPPLTCQVVQYAYNTLPANGTIGWHLTPDVDPGWVSGSRVKLTRANRTWNGTYRITRNPDNTYSLKNGPVQGHTTPTTGQMALVALPDGRRVGAFYSYSEYNRMPVGGVNADPLGKVSKKNPNREFLNVSFRHQQKRER